MFHCQSFKIFAGFMFLISACNAMKGLIIIMAMGVFVIPSWYPNTASPILGVFFKEQALYIGQMRPEWEVAISVWGQGHNAISIHNPSNIPTVIKRFADDSRKNPVVALEDNVFEYYNQALAWSKKICRGNIDGIVRANERNYLRALKQFKHIDIIHAHVGYPGGWAAMKLSEKFGLPYVITEHMSPFPFETFLDKKGDLKKILREPLQKADALVAVSPSLADHMEKHGLPKPLYIPNVVDEEFFRPLPSQLQNQNDKKFTFFTLGAMVPQKGISDLIKAIELFVSTLSDDDRAKVNFVIGGDGEEAQKYHRCAQQNDVNRWITWLGSINRNDARYQFQNCDCFVLPSRHETFGVVFAEAIACGKPLIATRSGGPECILNEGNGVLVEVGNPVELSKALGYMFKSAGNYDSSKIRADFLARFSRSAVVDQIEEVYRHAINGRKG